MKKAIVTIGISASGKSTFAKLWVAAESLNRVEINRDWFRKSLVEADGGEFTWDKWNWKREKEVTKLVNFAIHEAAGFEQVDVIISDTNLNEDNRSHLIELLESYGYDVEIKEFPVSLEEAWKRDAARKNGVGHAVIAKQYGQWLAYKGRKTYEPKKNLPKCILVDVDGTLAHMNGKRGAFEWDKVWVDEPDEAVIAVVNSIQQYTGFKIVILSGRDGCCREMTGDWLLEQGIGHHALIMRAPNDMRKDTIVKEEIFWRDIADNYNVQFVIDDRPSVVRMWQEIGLKTFAVGNQHIEF